MSYKLTDAELSWLDTSHAKRAGGRLTHEELGWLDSIFTQVNEELHETVSKLGVAPLRHQVQDAQATGLERVSLRLSRGLIKRAHAEDFLALEAAGRVRLSSATRKAETKRLKRKYKKRKKYTFRYGRKHNKQKAKTRKEYNNRKWEKDPLSRIKYTFNKPVHITPAEWAEYVQPVWEKYERKYLKFKCSERTMTVFNLVLEYHPPRERYARQTPKPVIVYDGYTQAVHAACAGQLKALHSEAVHSTMKK